MPPIQFQRAVAGSRGRTRRRRRELLRSCRRVLPRVAATTRAREETAKAEAMKLKDMVTIQKIAAGDETPP
jgi:hypothetical protein